MVLQALPRLEVAELDRVSLKLKNRHGKVEAILKIWVKGKTPDNVASVFYVSQSDVAEIGEEPVQLLEGTRYRYELDFNGVQPHSFYLDTSGNIGGIFSPDSTDYPATGDLETRLFTGLLPIYLYANDKQVASAYLEIRSYKLDYLTDYQAMLDKITEYSIYLLMNINMPSHERFTTTLSSSDAPSLQSRFAFLKSLLNSRSFIDAIERIIAMPSMRLESKDIDVDIRKAAKPTANLVRQLSKGKRRLPVTEPSHALYKKNITLPSVISDTRKYDTADTPENQFVKYVIGVFSTTITEISNRLATIIRAEESNKSVPSSYNRLLREMRALEAQLTDILSRSFFKSLSKLTNLPLSSPILQRKAGYREILQAWLSFDLALQLVWEAGDDIFGAGKRDVASLYEYWIFISIVEMLSAKGVFRRPVHEEIIEVTDDKFGLKLKSGQMLRLDGLYNVQGQSMKASLYYNRTFSAKSETWSRIFRPDITLELYPTDLEKLDAAKQKKLAYLHFDAKYRIQSRSYRLRDIDIIDVAEEKASETRDSYKRDDLLKMHSYKDAIYHTFGAYVLYPGTDQPELLCEDDSPIPSVGAFAIVPGKENQIGELANFLDEVVLRLVEMFSS